MAFRPLDDGAGLRAAGPVKRGDVLDPDRIAPLAAVVFAGLLIANKNGTDTYTKQVARAVGIAKQILAASAADFDVKPAEAAPAAPSSLMEVRGVDERSVSAPVRYHSSLDYPE
jgi:hypothetical protein